MVTNFRRDLLPNAFVYYQGEGFRLGKVNSRGYAVVYGDVCPKHRSRSKRSFSINVYSGGFRCFGCGVHGGDLIAWVRLRDSCDFRTACKTLGCWNDEGTFQPRPRALVQFLTIDFTINGERFSVSVRDEPLDYRDKLKRFYCDARDRLSEICRGGPEQYESERETCWERMAVFIDELREVGAYEHQ